MKVIVAGSRSITEVKHVGPYIDYVQRVYNITIDEIVSGCAKGVDQLGESWAIMNGVPVKEFPADWNNLGNAAGPIRNSKMADYADAAIIVWDGKSPGTLHMVREMKKRKKPVFIDLVIG
jgi:hypothetical protein